MYRGAIAWLFLVCVASAQLVEDDELFYRLLPRVEDPGTQALFDNRKLFFYTPAEIPPAFQSGARVHAVNTPAISNGNVHLPWSHTAGLHLCTDFATFKGIHLPRREDGSLYPVVVFKWPSGNYGWIFPVGTRVFEVLTLDTEEGNITFELRTRTRYADRWDDFQLFRPVRDHTELVSMLDNDSLIESLKSPDQRYSVTFKDNHNVQESFAVEGVSTETLPPLEDNDLVASMLRLEFKDCFGHAWRDAGDGYGPCYAPTVSREQSMTTSLSLFPPRYRGHLIDLSTHQTCLNCHSDAGRRVQRIDNDSGWRGLIKGNDGIFSFHPFEVSSISQRGEGREVKINKKLLDSGVVAVYDSGVHLSDRYLVISALKGD